MNPMHEFGICVLTDGAIWHQDLTTDAELFVKRLTQLQSHGEFLTFDMSSLFDLVVKKFPEILTTEKQNSYEYIYRVIFIFSRSNTIPHFTKNVQNILDSPIFFFDSLYLHSKPSKEIRPQDVYDFITEIEGKDHTAYFF